MKVSSIALSILSTSAWLVTVSSAQRDSYTNTVHYAHADAAVAAAADRSLQVTQEPLPDTCAGVDGQFNLHKLGGVENQACSYDVILSAYKTQVFDATGSTCSDNTLTAKEDLDAKLLAAGTGASTPEDAAAKICKDMYDSDDVTPFQFAASEDIDDPAAHFEQMFYNGRSYWQEETETLYESEDGVTPQSRLRDDASAVKECYQGDCSYSRLDWPDMLTNFEASTCTSNAAMCCWPRDRQANDGNGNCATPYDDNCVDKDVADNTNLCFSDLADGNLSGKYDSEKGFMAFPEDNNNGEGAIHCHGFAWANDEYEHTARYKANNLFFVSMYDHMYQRGYVKNIPGMPMCGCMDQMPLVTRSDCTQVDLTEQYDITFNGTTFTGKLLSVDVEFNACRGRNGRNNDLWAYVARLYDEKRVTAKEFGIVGRKLTNDHDCYHATELHKNLKGYSTSYKHDDTTWTKVAGRDELSDHTWGREGFNKAFFEQTLTAPDDPSAASFINATTGEGKTPIIYRACASCEKTHQKIYYRRTKPITNPNFDLLHNLIYQRNNGGGENVWNEHFTLHSTYQDAVLGADPWQCPNDVFNYYAPFYGECSPNGNRVRDQYSIWSWFPGPRPNVAYYINKPENEGVQDYIDDDASGAAARIANGIEDVDIGDVGHPGNTWFHDGVYHVTGYGSDIWGHSDQFHFYSESYSGDIDVSVHVSSFANNGGNGWAKAGIMLRSDNSVDSVMAFNLLAGYEGVNAHSRRSKGAHATHPGKVKDPIPQTSAWLRIWKKDDTVGYYQKREESDDWELFAADSVLFPNGNYRVGFAVTSHNNAYLSEATFENYAIEGTRVIPKDGFVNVGEPQQASDMQVLSGYDNLIGSGSGLSGGSDSFFFVNDQVNTTSPDRSVEMYIQRFDNWEISSRGGIMMRESNAADSSYAFVGAAGYDQGVVFQTRSLTGAETVHHKMIYVNNLNQFWVMLTKIGNTYTAYYKELEGEEWIQVTDSEDVTIDGPTMQVGRAVTAGTENMLTTVAMQTQNYSETTIQG